MHSQSAVRHPRIPEQQSVGQTLPPVPVGIDFNNTAPLPPGAMANGTCVQVQKYKVIVHNFIAEGGFAHVYLARIEGKSGYVVLKRVAVPDNERLRTVEKEIAFMRRLGDHKNITRYYASRIDPLPSGGFEALILIEYCPGGGVIDLMNRRLQQRLTEPEVLKIFGDVCEALAYMHYCNPPVLHRDLKVENILILSQDHYKLCDFGSAALSKGSYVPTNLQEIQKIEDDIQRHTTLQYRAPEMIDIYQRKPINEKADIWALGVLLYKLCYYTTPFEEQGQLAILNARYSIPTHPHFSDGLRRLIVSMLQENQNQRPNIYQVLKGVCQLRGVECPIRNIYTERPPPAEPTPKPSSQHESPTAIFERLPTPPQQIPEIVPMRRGRPVRHAKTDSLTEKTFDPFDPAHIASTASAATPSSSDLDDAFALNEQNLRAVAEDEKKVRNSMTFESDFQPTRPRSDVVASSSSPSSPDSKSRPLSNQPSGKAFSSKLSDFSSSQFSGGGLASLHKSSTAESNGVSPQPSSQRLRPAPQSNQSSGGANEKTQITPEETPTLRNNVSSDIEARLNALKMSVEGSSPTTSNDLPAPPKPSRSTKPTPPPKPARFRVAQNKAAPSSASSSAPPPKPTRSTTTDVADFESKFPTIEELYKNFPVSASGSNDSN